ncbi:MAG: IS66 family transposase, partial [Acidobacteria bacterium]|nr:IS66 family transposase [Acidobacteriota bacterium]
MASRETSPESLTELSREALIGRVLELEAQLAEAQIAELRRQIFGPKAEKLSSEQQALEPKLLPKSTLGKAVNYFLNEYPALVGYLQDGRLE